MPETIVVPVATECKVKTYLQGEDRANARTVAVSLVITKKNGGFNMVLRLMALRETGQKPERFSGMEVLLDPFTRENLSWYYYDIGRVVASKELSDNAEAQRKPHSNPRLGSPIYVSDATFYADTRNQNVGLPKRGTTVYSNLDWAQRLHSSPSAGPQAGENYSKALSKENGSFRFFSIKPGS